MSDYTTLVTAAKALTQGEAPDTRTLPVAENEWNTRPDTVSYGYIQKDFEADELTGDNRKLDRAFEGSFDLYSLSRTGDGWVPLIEAMLEQYCGANWYVNQEARYERETNLFHWEWVFQTAR